AVDPANPGSGFGVRLKTIPPEVFLGRAAASQDDAASIRLARAALPSSLSLLSPVYQIDRQGTAPASLTVSVVAPANSDIGKLDLYRFDVQGNRWQFLPSHSDADGKALVARVATVPDRVAVF